ncbi:iron-containing redox enzyme family protein [Streptacidiphilus sp. N1-10]|uniref:Iron-containing redox enzyme family protein n=1 Tax=Streptacidiphilus jeojiensis TaxID=3229225 RepID=A0ABV6XPA7_9ACTN
MTAPTASSAPTASPAPPASVALRIKLDLAGPAMRAATTALWRPSGLRSRYVEYLYAMHALIRSSVPLLERAALRCAELPPGDGLALPLRRYFEQHAAEERGHDDWLLADLTAAGADPAAALSRLPDPVVAELAGAQYYWVEHHHPVTLLGYVLVLEGNAPAPWLADRLADRTGLPGQAFRTLRDHAELDTGHTAALDALLDALPLTPAQEAAVAVSALRTADGVARLFHQLAAHPGGTR